MMISKSCFKCGEVKPLSDFYAHRGMADGRLNKCKVCARSDAAKTRSETPAAVVTGYRAKWLAENREKRRDVLKTWGEKNREKRRAQYQVSRAVASGAVVKLPCFVCGSEKSEAHHVAYDLPLSVSWLCRVHHAQTHRKDFYAFNF